MKIIKCMLERSVIDLKLTELFENVPDIEIKSLMADSRKKRPDAIFFCVKGMMFDGLIMVQKLLSIQIQSLI